MRLLRSAMGLLLSGVLLAQTNAANGGQSQTTDATKKGPTDGSSSGRVEVLTDTMGVDFKPYLDPLLETVRQHWYELIPESAGTKHGKVVLEFTVLKDGSVAGLRVVGSSGDVVLDRPAYGSIAGSNPFPPLPVEFKGPYLGLRLSYYYNLKPDGTPVFRISPIESTVATGSTVQFKAVDNDKDAAVTWSIVGCDDTCGTISSAGLYTAPPKIPNPSKVRIRATIMLISNRTAETTVTVVEPKH